MNLHKYTFCNLGCNLVYNHFVILCILSCYSVFHIYLKGYNPQTAKRRVGQQYSKIHANELSNHYVNYFSLNREGKLTLAANLGITLGSLRRWMRRKWQEEQDLDRAKIKLQEPYTQDSGLNVAGKHVIKYTLYFTKLVVVIITQFTQNCIFSWFTKQNSHYYMQAWN